MSRRRSASTAPPGSPRSSCRTTAEPCAELCCSRSGCSPSALPPERGGDACETKGCSRRVAWAPCAHRARSRAEVRSRPRSRGPAPGVSPFASPRLRDRAGPGQRDTAEASRAGRGAPPGPCPAGGARAGCSRGGAEPYRAAPCILAALQQAPGPGHCLFLPEEGPSPALHNVLFQARLPAPPAAPGPVRPPPAAPLPFPRRRLRPLRPRPGPARPPPPPRPPPGAGSDALRSAGPSPRAAAGCQPLRSAASPGPLPPSLPSLRPFAAPRPALRAAPPGWRKPAGPGPRSR